jgi:hypothetical protein
MSDAREAVAVQLRDTIAGMHPVGLVDALALLDLVEAAGWEPPEGPAVWDLPHEYVDNGDDICRTCGNFRNADLHSTPATALEAS